MRVASASRQSLPCPTRSGAALQRLAGLGCVSEKWGALCASGKSAPYTRHPQSRWCVFQEGLSLVVPSHPPSQAEERRRLSHVPGCSNWPLESELRSGLGAGCCPEQSFQPASRSRGAGESLLHGTGVVLRALAGRALERRQVALCL